MQKKCRGFIHEAVRDAKRRRLEGPASVFGRHGQAPDRLYLGINGAWFQAAAASSIGFGNSYEILGSQARATDQHAVDVIDTRQLPRVGGLDRAAVE